MKSFAKLWIVLFAATALSSCATDGKYFKSELQWIKQGQTTQENVTSMLGKPYSVGNASGTPTWTYGYYRYRLIGQSYTKELKFYWDEQHKVKNFSFSSSFPDDRAAAVSPSSSSSTAPAAIVD